jgi:hypothetical protein
MENAGFHGASFALIWTLLSVYDLIVSDALLGFIGVAKYKM